jgi:hypothetical protein
VPSWPRVQPTASISSTPAWSGGRTAVPPDLGIRSRLAGHVSKAPDRPLPFTYLGGNMVVVVGPMRTSGMLCGVNRARWGRLSLTRREEWGRGSCGSSPAALPSGTRKPALARSGERFGTDGLRSEARASATPSRTSCAARMDAAGSTGSGRFTCPTDQRWRSTGRLSIMPWRSSAQKQTPQIPSHGGARSGHLIAYLAPLVLGMKGYWLRVPATKSHLFLPIDSVLSPVSM